MMASIIHMFSLTFNYFTLKNMSKRSVSQFCLYLICWINKVSELGDKVVKDKQEISEGYYAVLEAPQGNTFGVWQDK